MTEVLKKPTFLSISVILITLIGVPMGIYYSNQGGGVSLAGSLVFVGLFILWGLFIIDRLVVSKIGALKLTLIEFCLTVSFIILYSYCTRKLYIDIFNDSIDYLIIVPKSGDLRVDTCKYEFPFNQRIGATKSLIVVEKSENYELQKNPKSWGDGYVSWSKTYGKFNDVTIITKIDSNLDSLITEKLILKLLKEGNYCR